MILKLDFGFYVFHVTEQMLSKIFIQLQKYKFAELFLENNNIFINKLYKTPPPQKKIYIVIIGIDEDKMPKSLSIL